MKEPTLTKADLSNFYGSGVWYKHSLVKNILYTEGVQYVAEHGGAYWLVDEIAFSQALPTIKAEAFQVWDLIVHPDQTATLKCGDGDGNEVFSKNIDFTDFPLETIRFYCTNNVILLTSEY